jgi:photosystem II stability/assembly factor-like uncharacterized protein
MYELLFLSNMKKIFILVSALSLISLTGFGCIKIASGPTGTSGGIYKTTDQAETWLQKVAFPTAKGVGSVGHVNVGTIEIDPSDHLAVYAGTKEDGLLYSYDGAETWNSAKDLDTGPVSSIAVDSENKCVIYAASRNKIYKSEDCNRSFKQVYYETRTETSITDVKVDWYNHALVYAGTTEGDLLKSADAGASWSALNRFKSDISDILVDPFDSRVIYVGLKSKGLFKTTDSGATWVDLSENFKDFKNANYIYFIAADKTSQNTIIVASQYGLLRSYDAGASWSAIELVTPPGEVQIRALALNPREGKEIYYATATAVYKTVDGGKSWVTKKVPATGCQAETLAVDQDNGKVIYLGLSQVKT